MILLPLIIGGVRFQNSQGSLGVPHIGVGSSIGGLGGRAVGGAGGTHIGGDGLTMCGVGFCSIGAIHIGVISLDPDGGI
jgi:hypothetical protein